MAEQQPSAFLNHPRRWREMLYVYPVISRRSRGLSIGINLNPDRRCTFACVYCQIDRTKPRGRLTDVELAILRDELSLVLGDAISGRLWREEPMIATPATLRRVNDIAFSGEGEPTCLANFDQAVLAAAEVKRAAGADDVKLVVITNATLLQSPQVRRALPILDFNNGEIWAKLDAGTEEFFARINRPAAGVTLAGVMEGIIEVSRGRPVVIQTLFLRDAGQGPSAAEVHAYIARLRQIIDAGGKIKSVHIHTVARRPAEPTVTPLTNDELDVIARLVDAAIAPVPVEIFYGYQS